MTNQNYLMPGLLMLFLLAGCASPVEKKQNPEEKLTEKNPRVTWFDAIEKKKNETTFSINESWSLTPSEFALAPIQEPYKTFMTKQNLPCLTTAENDELLFDDTQKIMAELQFEAANLKEIVPVFAELLDFEYLVTQECNGLISMRLQEQLTKKELFLVFLQILQQVGFYAEYQKPLVKIRPTADLSQSAALHTGAAIELGVFHLKNVPVKEIAPQLKSILSPGVVPLELESSNRLIFADTREAIAKARLLLQELDSNIRSQWSKTVIPCREISASRIAAELTEILPILGFPVVNDSDKAAPEAVQLKSLERLQIIVASAANEEALNELTDWVRILDRNDADEQERLYIYPIQNCEAVELVKALSVMFPVDGTTISMKPSGKEDQNASLVSEDFSSAKHTAPAENKTDGGGPGSVFEIPVKIFGDAVRNRLLIRTTAKSYALIKALLDKLDTVPAQVLLQVLVIEVNLNDSVKFGVEFMMQSTNGNVESIGGTNYKNLTPDSGQNAQYGANYWIFNPDNPEEKYGYINALAGQTNVKVISSPQVLIISHNEAEISVGNKVPIVNSEITNTQSVAPTPTDPSTNLVRNIQYQDTGIILKITPKVTRGGRITIQMDQTVSEAQENKTSKIDSPEIQERILKTVMNIQDGQTIICGGIIRERSTDNLNTIPLIGSIPFLRRLVGDTDVSTQRTEMLILISGKIITEETKLEDLLQRYQQSVDKLVEFENGQTVSEQKNSRNTQSWFFE